MEIILATNNSHKLSEIRAKVDNSFKVLSLYDVGFGDEIPETGFTLEENAMQKALFIFDLYKKPVIADDSGLEIAALNGAPGVDTAHFSGSRDPIANMNKVLRLLEKESDRSAKFRTVIAYVDPRQSTLFQGEVLGNIAPEMSGSQGFGYDPIFIPEGRTQTFAAMGAAAKSEISHRIRALDKLQSFLIELADS